ncbi:hypothetical protein CXF59_14010 [Flavobacterium sp. ALD4]|jgi:hypothetical protein|uniref:hypothetical protein n=1 Tax=Flavobacterium sp. ALD4 TaxID=2058314 RepID=UPI000C31E138|nr:hypothetical protein [Flavobacterium sp. ALD4]PKH67008.1 hypothetical protein CXF59_14010 [Flavobacterium sp. ALD4]
MKNLKKFGTIPLGIVFIIVGISTFKEDDIVKKLFLFAGILILLIRLLAFISDSVKSINKTKDT